MEVPCDFTLTLSILVLAFLNVFKWIYDSGMNKKSQLNLEKQFTTLWSKVDTLATKVAYLNGVLKQKL